MISSERDLLVATIMFCAFMAIFALTATCRSRPEMEPRGAVATSLYQPNGACHGNGGDIHRPDFIGCKDRRVSKWIKRDTASALRFRGDRITIGWPRYQFVAYAHKNMCARPILAERAPFISRLQGLRRHTAKSVLTPIPPRVLAQPRPSCRKPPPAAYRNAGVLARHGNG